MKQKTKRVCSLMLALLLTQAVMAQSMAGYVWAQTEETEYIYFDLNAGNVTITKNSYTGLHICGWAINEDYRNACIDQ